MNRMAPEETSRITKMNGWSAVKTDVNIHAYTPHFYHGNGGGPGAGLIDLDHRLVNHL